MAFTTPVSPIETPLRKVFPELCVNDLPERVAEVEMSSADPVRGDPLPDWLQPFDENWSMRKNRKVIVWKYTRIYRMMTKKERELLHKEKELDRYP